MARFKDYTLNAYQIDAARPCRRFDDIAKDLAHMSLGLATESGEFTTEVKRLVAYDKPLDTPMTLHMIEELGDMLFYLANACTFLQINLEDVAEQNTRKLERRFPSSFTPEAAEARADKGGLGPRES